MHSTDSTQAPAYLIQAVICDDLMETLPTLFTRRADRRPRVDESTGPSVRQDGIGDLTTLCFSELEARILMKLLDEDNYHSSWVVVPILIRDSSHVDLHLQTIVDGSPWIEMDLEGVDGDPLFRIAGSVIAEGPTANALMALNDAYDGSFFEDCGANVRVREDRRRRAHAG